MKTERVNMAETELDENLLLAALEAATKAGADYAEVRSVTSRSQDTRVKNGLLSKMQEQHESGWGLQVRVGSGWGFASSAELTATSLQNVVAQAHALAKASNTVQKAARNSDPGTPSSAVGNYSTPFQIDPFKVPASERLEMLFSAEANLRQAVMVKVAEAHQLSFLTQKFFANTAGANQHQTIVECGGGLSAIAVEGGYSYQRTYGRFGNYHQAGYEFVLGMKLEDAALRIGQEAAELVVAEECPSGPTTVVIGSNLAALIVHESCGHPTELDRVLGSEEAFAGGSFLQPAMQGQFRYGSQAVNLTADAQLAEGLGTFGWDDEGTPAQRVELVKGGLFSHYMSSRDTASAIGQSSAGMARASSWGRIPLVRMTNVSLEPGSGSLTDLIGSVENGLYLDTPSSWSLDDKRMNFHFSAEVCREIKNGQLGKLYKGASFQARTPDFWGNCQRVAGPEEWRLWGFLNCAKGEPLQTAHVGHGASPLVVDNINVQREGR